MSTITNLTDRMVITQERFAGWLATIAADPWNGGWWMQAALQAWASGRYRLIGERGSSGAVYLARFWLSTPQHVDGGHPDDQVWDSGNSVMLHYFLRGDDDDALHDHPWAFSTTILQGSYIEVTPPSDVPCWDDDLTGGPPADDRATRTRRCVGDHVQHQATDLHMVEAVTPGTWTLVRTGARVRDWGFWPAGQAWVPWRTYLGEGAAA